MAISGIGQNYYQNNVETKKNTKNVNGTEKFPLEKTGSTQELSEAEEMELFKKEFYEDLSKITMADEYGGDFAVSWDTEKFQAVVML